ncbi:MAG: DNA-binding response regulator [Sulfurimonas sp.]|nr:DNA-binding response regulator [Sulfurimonas sp.]
MLKELKNLNIILAEDDLGMQADLKEVFEYFFLNVYTASNGKEALEILDKQDIFAIFSDYSMPIMNGFELTTEVRKFDLNIPITILSNYDDRNTLQKFMSLGLEGYIFKPFYYDDIKDYLTNFAKKIHKANKLLQTVTKKYKIDFLKNTLYMNENVYTLTKLESDFLNLLASNAEEAISYDKIITELSEYELNLLKVRDLIYRLKKKYGFNYIKNIKDLGYTLEKL